MVLVKISFPKPLGLSFNDDVSHQRCRRRFTCQFKSVVIVSHSVGRTFDESGLSASAIIIIIYALLHVCVCVFVSSRQLVFLFIAPVIVKQLHDEKRIDE